jgi:hypothetical protein
MRLEFVKFGCFRVVTAKTSIVWNVMNVRKQ